MTLLPFHKRMIALSLAAGLFLLLLSALWQGTGMPLFEAWQQTQQQAALLKRTQNLASQHEQLKTDYTSQVTKYKANPIMLATPQQAGIKVQQQVRSIALSQQMQVGTSRTSAAVKVDETYSRISLTLATSTSYNRLLDFIAAVETADPALLIKNIHIQKQAGRQSGSELLSLQIEIEALFEKDGGVP